MIDAPYLAELAPLLSVLADRYEHARPFPHIVLDDIWPADLLDAVVGEFAPPNDWRWRRYDAEHERKLEGGPACWGDATIRLLAELAALASALEALTGVDGLVMDTEGGGHHMIQPGGFLSPHVDFTHASASGLYRRVNVLVYLNRDWAVQWGGQLELWGMDGPEVTLDPVFNRTVVFSCSDASYHGHPRPVVGPLPRRSVAAYFFSPDPPPDCGEPHSTVWKS